MHLPSLQRGALLGALTSLPLMALLYLGEQFARLPFVPFDLFDWLARALPGDVITLGIDAIVRAIRLFNLGSTSEAAKLLEQLMALALFVTIGAVVGLVTAGLLRRSTLPATQVGAAVGAAAALLLLVIEMSLGRGGGLLVAALWLLVLFGAWGAILGSRLATPATPVPGAGDAAPTTRRAALGQLVGGSLLLTLAAWGAGRFFAGQSGASGAGQALPAAPAPAPTQPGALAGAVNPTLVPSVPSTEALEGRFDPAPGTRPELTPNDDFYRIDINTRPVVIQEESWALEVDGLFDSPRTFTLAELMARPAVVQPLTMGCISNRVAGDLIGTSNWTGVPLRDLLEELGIQPEATALYVEAADGFYETVVMEDMMDPRALLVYGMNGETLPVEHGFPLRIYIPNRYGMKQPKWITRISAVSEREPGYWVVRGWSQEARPQIVSVIDVVARGAAENGTVPVGGIAWAGDRGIQKVELQIDGGEWVEAQLREPPLSALTWVQWRYDWAAPAGRHTLRVRATDGTGTLQTEQEQGVRPDGATGYHERPVMI